MITQQTPTQTTISVPSFTEEGVFYDLDLETGKCPCRRGEVKQDDHKHHVYARALVKATQSLRTQRAREEVAATLLETLKAAYAPVRAKDNPMDSYRFACSVGFGPEIRRVAFERHAKVLERAERRASRRGAA